MDIKLLTNRNVFISRTVCVPFVYQESWLIAAYDDNVEVLGPLQVKRFVAGLSRRNFASEEVVHYDLDQHSERSATNDTTSISVAFQT
jgi:hypothetical protein